MALTVFYSWQSDTPNSINRGFIEDALAKAIKQLAAKIEIQDAIRNEEIKLDKDTQGVPGIPPIVETIFNKIDKCAIFVPDLTFVGQSPEGRMLPNPNVLIEYGWALKSLSYSRIIPVMNTAFGEPTADNLPFDMRHLRNPITYHLSPEASSDERTEAKANLVKILAHQIETFLKSGLLEESLSKSQTVEEYTYENPSRFTSPDEVFTIIRTLRHGDTNIFIPNIESLFLRLIPAYGEEAIKSQKIAYEMIKASDLKPMGSGGYGSNYRERNKFGSFVCDYKDDKVISVTQLFLSKQLWGIDLDSIEKTYHMDVSKVDFGYFPSSAIEVVFNKTLANYLNFASTILKLKLPIQFIAGASDVEGFRMAVSRSYVERFQGSVVNKHIIFKGVISDYKQKTTEILRPLFNHIWDECGLERPDVEIV
ncbi:MAG: hypothetical protein AABZ15_15130 [Nitrospirota bacterium]